MFNIIRLTILSLEHDSYLLCTPYFIIYNYASVNLVILVLCFIMFSVIYIKINSRMKQFIYIILLGIALSQEEFRKSILSIFSDVQNIFK